MTTTTITATVDGDLEEAAEYLRHIANEIGRGMTMGFEGSGGSSWSSDVDDAEDAEEEEIIRPCKECGEETDDVDGEPGFIFRDGTVMCQSCTHNAYRSGWNGEGEDE